MSIGLQFPGQGFQKIGMLKPWAAKYAKIVMPVIEEAQEALPRLPVRQALLGETSEDITRTSTAQPLILTASTAIFKTYEQLNGTQNIKFVMGHSLGEYSALVAAGILGFREAIRLVHQRGLAMQEAAELSGETSMLLVVEPRSKAENFRQSFKKLTAKHNVDDANHNTQKQTVVAGRKSDLEAFYRDLKTLYPRTASSWLNVSGAFHSRYMKPAQLHVQAFVGETSFRYPGKFEVISNLNAKPYHNISDIKLACVEALIKPVKWFESLSYMDNEVDQMVSIGPGRIGDLAVRHGCKKPILFYDLPT